MRCIANAIHWNICNQNEVVSLLYINIYMYIHLPCNTATGPYMDLCRERVNNKQRKVYIAIYELY